MILRSLLIYLVVFSKLVYSQDLSFVQYTTHNGLPSNQVYNIYQDDNGFIWFATDRGIASYDGNKFNKYDQKNGLPSSTVFRFYPQKNGNVWCSTFSNKWFYFNKDNFSFNSYEFNDTVVKYSNGALNENLYLSNDGVVNIGFQTHSGVLSISEKGEVVRSIDGFFNNDLRVDVVEFKKNMFFNYSLNEIPSKSPLSSYDFNYNYHVIAKEKLGFYHKSFRYANHSYFSNHNELIIYNDSTKIEKSFDNDIIGIGAFDSTHLWLGFTKGGIKVVNLYGEEVQHYLKDESVTYCFKDVHNGLWMSTLTSGVFYARNKHMKKYSLKDDYISFVNNGKEDKVFVGTFFGNNYEVDENFSKLVYSNINEKPFYNFYNNLYESYLDAGSYIDKKCFQLRLKSKKYILSRISALCSDKENPFLIAGTHSFSYFNSNSISPITKHIDKRIRTLCWKENGIYIGTLNGLLVYDTLANKFSGFKEYLLNVRVESVKYKNRIAYIGTMGHGLIIKDQDSITQISSRDGLSSDLVNSVFVENDSVIWVATNNGLNRVFRFSDSLSVEVFNEDDGLPDGYITDVFVKNNIVWIATKSGLCSMQNRFFTKQKEVNLFLNWSAISNQNILLNDSLLGDLNFRQNNLIFSYDAAFFSANNGISFRYKFDGKEENWNYTSSRQIKYSLLSPGNYFLKIQASVNGSNWSENEISKYFVIHPPFYQSNWFYLIVIVLIVIVFYLFFKLRVLTYNRDIVRELLRYILKKITPKTNNFTVKEQGVDVKINSSDVLFVKSDGNYLEIHTDLKRHVIRCKIGDFLKLVPDKIEYLRVSRFYIVRIDKIQAKGVKTITIREHQISVGRTYQSAVDDLPF